MASRLMVRYMIASELLKSVILTGTAVAGSPRAVAIAGRAPLVEELGRGALEGVVTVARGHRSRLAGALKNALAKGLGIADVEGRLVVDNVVPALVHVNLSIVGPAVTQGPEGGPASAAVGRKVGEPGDDQAVLVGGLGLESQGVTAGKASALEDSAVINTEVDLVVAGDLCQALGYSIGLVLIDDESRVGVRLLYTDNC
jgi:hypothetical protein